MQAQLGVQEADCLELPTPGQSFPFASFGAEQIESTGALPVAPPLRTA